MKKLVLVLFAMTMMVACNGNQTSNNTVTNDTDTVVTDTVDTVSTDTCLD